MPKKLTVDEFKRRVKEALTGPLPGQNGGKRLRKPGLLQDLLKGTRGVTPPTKEV